MSKTTPYRARQLSKERQVIAYAVANPEQVAPARAYADTATLRGYTGNRMDSSRPGADDHLLHASVAMRIQITVRTS